ncbi:hypothetical protein EV132_1721 [Rhizobium sullae]|uniref:Uncharacterized protein n=1 Tax=Rhizobium sullae TaxID=50338 RepID=A0A4R3PPT1_RHISU|nr:hypothetical protein EV132_1721 [Rhizobium sullae]
MTPPPFGEVLVYKTMRLPDNSGHCCCEFMLNRDLRGCFKLTGVSHLGEQFFAEDSGRGSIAKALARRGIEVVADLDQICVCDRQWIDLSRKPFPYPTVGVLDRAFLPG